MIMDDLFWNRHWKCIFNSLFWSSNIKLYLIRDRLHTCAKSFFLNLVINMQCHYCWRELRRKKVLWTRPWTLIFQGPGLEVRLYTNISGFKYDTLGSTFLMEDPKKTTVAWRGPGKSSKLPWSYTCHHEIINVMKVKANFTAVINGFLKPLILI